MDKEASVAPPREQIFIPLMGHLWLIQKKLMNKMAQFDAITVLIQRINFLQRGATN